MGNPYCEKHEWSANHPLGRCRDCIELEQLKDALILMRHERDEARRNLDHYVGELESTKLQVDALKRLEAVVRYEHQGKCQWHSSVCGICAELKRLDSGTETRSCSEVHPQQDVYHPGGHTENRKCKCGIEWSPMGHACGYYPPSSGGQAL